MSLWNNKGAALNNLGRINEGLGCCETALKIDSNFEYAWKNKGISLIGLNRFTEALQALNRALDINPHFQLAKDAKHECIENPKFKEKLDQKYSDKK